MTNTRGADQIPSSGARSPNEAAHTEQSASSVNIPPVPDVVKKNLTLVQIELVKDAINSSSQLELRTALEPLVRKILQSGSHLVHLALNGFPG
jgi:hypothetical protein